LLKIKYSPINKGSSVLTVTLVDDIEGKGDNAAAVKFVSN
jgi:hypothetical protein